MTALLSVIVLAANALAPLSGPAESPPFFSSPAPISQAKKPADGFMNKATCTAQCGGSPSVQCTGSSCSAVNQSCPWQQGYVVCNGNQYTFCPVCACSEGSYKTETVGPTCGCPDGMSTPEDTYKCIGGEWVYQYSGCGGPFCQGPP